MLQVIMSASSDRAQWILICSTILLSALIGAAYYLAKAGSESVGILATQLASELGSHRITLPRGSYALLEGDSVAVLTELSVVSLGASAPRVLHYRGHAYRAHPSAFAMADSVSGRIATNWWIRHARGHFVRPRSAQRGSAGGRA